MSSSSAATSSMAASAANTSSAAEFQAVDLDAVLDEFESSQNLVEEEEKTPPSTQKMTQETNSSEPASLEPNKMKPNLLEDLKPVSNDLEENLSKFKQGQSRPKSFILLFF